MTHQEKWADLNVRIKSAQKIEPLKGFVRDGVVNLEKWCSQSIHPLFIGKKAHGKDDWSITEHCMNARPVQFCRDSPRSWPKTAYISYALQHNFAEYNAAIRSSASVSEALRNIAFINVGKYGAGTQTPPKRLTDLYMQNRTFLHEQIELCQPNVIIGWNTLGLFENDKEFMKRFANGRGSRIMKNGVSSWAANGQIFVSAKHPAYFKIPAKRYIDSVVAAVKTHFDDLNHSLPVL